MEATFETTPVREGSPPHTSSRAGMGIFRECRLVTPWIRDHVRWLLDVCLPRRLSSLHHSLPPISPGCSRRSLSLLFSRCWPSLTPLPVSTRSGSLVPSPPSSRRSPRQRADGAVLVTKRALHTPLASDGVVNHSALRSALNHAAQYVASRRRPLRSSTDTNPPPQQDRGWFARLQLQHGRVCPRLVLRGGEEAQVQASVRVVDRREQRGALGVSAPFTSPALRT